MRVVAVDESLEKRFLDYVTRDVVDFYFFIFDWRWNRDQTKVFLAMEGDSIRGLLLIYDDHILQFRGDHAAVKLLMESVDLKDVELSAPLDCEDLVLTKWAPRVKHRMDVMSVEKGNEKVQISTLPEKAARADAAQIAELLRTCDPEWWGEMTEEGISRGMETALWYVIKKEGSVVSAGMGRALDFGGCVGVAATKNGYRDRGFATSIVSVLVREMLKEAKIALIYVLSDNGPAIRAYSKVGYKRYKTYLQART